MTETHDKVAIERDGKSWRLVATTRVNKPIDDVFAFFSDAGNLDRLTPPYLRFTIITPRPIEMREGTLINYKLYLHGIPIRWESEITAWDPPHRFVDEQRRGPYRLWHHTHEFHTCDEGTEVIDEVRYIPAGGAIINTLFVKRDLRRIFGYRASQLRTIFGA